ncbi:alpha/beta hydrolase [Bradyrhizobium sp.]|uniref:alpha/beta fold hydrolase n=1 Tax=Bradyrhizobium sp. TaxID=376 RepID=UPI0025C2B646|nr:alpha/beta hydrolase [Bradyrhizobium sp.]
MMPGQDSITLDHGMADIAPGVRLHYVTVGAGPRMAVLLHGFPQTWQAWRRVIPLLVKAGYCVVAPDYRGAGHSARPSGGYDKRTMARDIRILVRERLGIGGPLILIGHDIGLMVAYAYAAAFPDEVSHLVVMDAPLPGTAVFDRLRADPRVWQFAFHAVRDIPEMLVAGRERQYVQAFVDARIYDPSAISAAELDAYAAAYAAPGGLRAGFELYRAFDQDIADNREGLARSGKLKMPVLAVGGAVSTTGPLMADMMREVADDVSEFRVPRTGHWIAEENPGAFVERLREFLG